MSAAAQVFKNSFGIVGIRVEARLSAAGGSHVPQEPGLQLLNR
jgi:hypothetical protein